MKEDYYLIGLKNHILSKYYENISDKLVYDDRFRYKLHQDLGHLTEKVYSKILDKLADHIADDITSKIIDCSLKDN